MSTSADIELTMAALKACGYRTKLRERCGTQWVDACNGLQVRYVHWHPLTNITQAMQLLIEAPGNVTMETGKYGVSALSSHAGRGDVLYALPATAQDLINAQCRAIVTAIAGLQV
jgi:hypothetical protein